MTNITEIRVLTRRPDRTLDWVAYAEQAGVPMLFDGPAIDAAAADAEHDDEAAS